MRKILYYGESITGVEDSSKTIMLDVLNVKKLGIVSRVTFPEGATESFFIRVKTCSIMHTVGRGDYPYNYFSALYKQFEFKPLEADSNLEKTLSEVIDVETMRKIEITFINSNASAVTLDLDVEGSEMQL